MTIAGIGRWEGTGAQYEVGAGGGVSGCGERSVCVDAVTSDGLTDPTARSGGDDGCEVTGVAGGLGGFSMVWEAAEIIIGNIC